MTRYARTVVLLRLAHRRLADEREKKERAAGSPVREPLKLFERLGPLGDGDVDFDRYQLAFTRDERDGEP